MVFEVAGIWGYLGCFRVRVRGFVASGLGFAASGAGKVRGNIEGLQL